MELIDELLSKEGVTPTGSERTVALIGEYDDSFTILEEWIPLIQQKTFKILFKEPPALKTEDGTYLLTFHLRKRVPVEEIPQEVIMVGSLRLQAWHPSHKNS